MYIIPTSHENDFLIYHIVFLPNLDQILTDPDQILSGPDQQLYFILYIYNYPL